MQRGARAILAVQQFRLWNLLAVKPQTSYLISPSLCLFGFFFFKAAIFGPLEGLSAKICLSHCRGSKNLNSLPCHRFSISAVG